MEKHRKELEEQNVTLLASKNDLFTELQAEQSNLADSEERIAKLVSQRCIKFSNFSYN